VLRAGTDLGKAEDPPGSAPGRRAGIDHLRASGPHAVEGPPRLSRRRVRQAQHNEIHLAHQAGAGGRVLALLGCDALDLNAREVGDPAPDLEASGAGLAIDENGGRCPCVSWGPRAALWLGVWR